MMVVAMSQSELPGFDILQRVERGELRLSDEAASLRLCPRKIYRLLDRLRSDRRFSDAFRDRIVTLVRERYADFGPTLACEYLAEQHGITLSRETLRQMLMVAGMWKAKVAKRAWLHQSRYRRECRGELAQVDGPDHDWLESRGPRCTLLV